VRARLLWLVTVLALGGLVGLLITRDPGYVLVAYDDMAVETSLWFALVVLAAGYLLVRILLFLGIRVARGRGALREWNVNRRVRAADQRTLQGLTLLAEGQWAPARKLLQRAAPAATAPLVNLLGAARAAARAGDQAGRDALLREARARAPDAALAIDFTQASLEHEARAWASCRVTLERLRVRHPSHPEVLWMLADCHVGLEDWQALSELVPMLQRDHSRPPELLAALEQQAWLGRLAAGSEPAGRVWASLPKPLRRSGALVGAYARAEADEHPDAAERVLREALQHHWDAELVILYGQLASGDPVHRLATAEGWLKSHADDPALFLTLGRLCLQNRRWSQAREHFEMSLRLRPTPQAQGELGRLCVALGDPRGAGLLLEALPELPRLPLPDSRSAG